MLTKISPWFTLPSIGLHQRRVELDWLRIIAVGLLFFYHVGMLYVERWGFHIKSQYLSSTLEGFMLMLNPWRMSLLWLISGVASYCILQKNTAFTFLITRSKRLLLPLMIGVWVVVPPQLYFEMLQKGQMPLSFLEFCVAFVQFGHPIFENYSAGIWPHVDVNHLWYLRELWHFTLILVLLIPVIKLTKIIGLVSDGFSKRPKITLLVAAVLLGVFDWWSQGSREVIGFYFLIFGFIVAQAHSFWIWVKQHFFYLLASFVISFVILLFVYFLVWTAGESHSLMIKMAVKLIYNWVRWSGLLLVVSFAMNYLCHNPPWLSKLSNAVFPFYIFHQTAIITFGSLFGSLSLGWVLEPMLVILLSSMLSISLVIVVNSIGIGSLFGMKRLGDSRSKPNRFYSVINGLLVAIMAFTLLF